ncbi:MAG: cobalamin-binding protein [Acidobacteria bacterium]|nr:cobalamin-binding protein [Acidobacteriota bacterium]
MKIVSLVPNATEILFALGAGDQVVGVSHECDFPPEARSRPILTGSALAPGMTPAEVDAAVSAQIASGASLYTLDEARLAALAPDLLFTQELCPVCAVSTAQVDGAVASLPRCPEVISLDPTRLEDVLADVLHVGARIGREREAEALVDSLRERLVGIERAVRGRPRPTVVALEWLDPPFLGGHWVPQMLSIAGGRDPFGVAPGERSRRATWEEIAAVDPDWIVAMPCGFDEAGARGELAKLAGRPEWESLRAVGEEHVAAVDANGCFSRPGPRMVDGVETLARRLHPAAF